MAQQTRRTRTPTQGCRYACQRRLSAERHGTRSHTRRSKHRKTWESTSDQAFTRVSRCSGFVVACMHPGARRPDRRCRSSGPARGWSLTDLVAALAEPVTAEQVNQSFDDAASGHLKGLLRYNEGPIVSRDIIGDPASCIFRRTAHPGERQSRQGSRLVRQRLGPHQPSA
ncbi:hypothetical protein [Kribbella turkmenica]|uniref:hypothetical protein n=1 Tax=Kribbella turkmenica TaxID=2530375 RepID=UPI0038994CB2